MVACLAGVQLRVGGGRCGCVRSTHSVSVEEAIVEVIRRVRPKTTRTVRNVVRDGAMSAERRIWAWRVRYRGVMPLPTMVDSAGFPLTVMVDEPAWAPQSVFGAILTMRHQYDVFEELDRWGYWNAGSSDDLGRFEPLIHTTAGW